MKIYTIRRTYKSIILEINSEKEYDIIISESDNNNKIITLKSTKLIIETVSSSESESLQKSKKKTLEQI